MPGSGEAVSTRASREGARPAVLVAGGAGYIGSHTAKALYRAGFQPVILDNLSTGNRSNVRYGSFYQSCVEDGESVSRIVRDHPIAAVILFAANAYVGESTIH